MSEEEDYKKVQTLQEQMKEAKEEKKLYKATGVYITRKARKVLQEYSREK